MKEDEEFIRQLRKITPATMPTDLRAALNEGIQPRKHRHWSAPCALVGAIAACVILVLNLRDPEGPPTAGPPAVSMVHVDSTILSTETLGYEEIDGLIHEVRSERWIDRYSASTSVGGDIAYSVVTREDIVRVPVQFL